MVSCAGALVAATRRFAEGLQAFAHRREFEFRGIDHLDLLVPVGVHPVAVQRMERVLTAARTALADGDVQRTRFLFAIEADDERKHHFLNGTATGNGVVFAEVVVGDVPDIAATREVQRNAVLGMAEGSWFLLLSTTDINTLLYK